MKTIFVTISRGASARNILQTDVYRELKESGHRIVILTPAYQDERFLREFSAPNVFFENLIEPAWTVFDSFFVGWNKALVYNRSTAVRDRYGIYNLHNGNIVKYCLKKMIFWPLSKLPVLKDFFRWLDACLVKDIYYKDVFEKYAPDLLFASSVMEDGDVAVLKQAKQRGIRTIGAVKSWDNISKMSFRVKTDKLMVWGEYSKSESRRFQNYKDEDIVICGVPQFDFYVSEKKILLSREEFCRQFGIDPSKKIIVFTSGGKIVQKDGEVAQIIADFINSKRLMVDATLLIRPHFAYLNDEKKFFYLTGVPNVILDTEYERSQVFRDHWDYSKKQIERFTNMIAHADVVIATGSTVCLDAAAFDKPTINIAFDGYEHVPFSQSIARGYSSEHNSSVLETGGVWLVKSAEELRDALDAFLANPTLLQDGRKLLRDYFCHQIDGKSGQRMAEEILKMVSPEPHSKLFSQDSLSENN